MSKISAIILDWAGTTVDYGCFAPVNAFITAFAAFGITPTMEETRAPMGLQKRAHIAQMLAGERLAALWVAQHGRPHNQADVDQIYDQFEPALFAVLAGHTDPLPGAVETVNAIKQAGISIGSTTGYTRAMMDVVVPLAAQKGYAPDSVVCPDETGGIGRPAPYMLWKNLEKLGVASIHEVLKIGDTVADMQEGKNAGCLCVGTLRGSSMLGLTEAELARQSDARRAALFATARQKYLAAGADYVLEDITALPALLTSLQ
ncbi:MAG: phosphonoacetaldehyde hydrolase [Oscillospiraceae bacterium]|jgi:phosphonoacetaldehyde hydrolase|nr:phosphonoacetaldehyde hydrolase [Oscillospiraceae bacterium]